MKNSKKWLNLSKLIMLTFVVCCATITFVGCENGNIKVNKPEAYESGNMLYSGENEILDSRK